jgi:hypothetical protein
VATPSKAVPTGVRTLQSAESVQILAQGGGLSKPKVGLPEPQPERKEGKP